MGTLKKSEQYEKRAKEIVKASFDSDSLTNWDEVKSLKAKAEQAKSDEIQKARENIISLVESVSSKLGTELTLSYIGNSSDDYDDRGWFISAPHPDRVGTHKDRFGMHKTSELEELLALCESGLEDWAIHHQQEFSKT